MAFPIFILNAIKAYSKAKMVKQAIELMTKKDVNKVDVAMSFIPGLTGKATRQLRRYQKVCKESVRRIALNEEILKKTKIKMIKQRAEKNILKAKELKSKWIKKEIKKSLVKKIPGRSLYMSIKQLGEGIYNKESWKKIATRAGTLLGRLGVNEANKLMGTINKASNTKLTANQFWKSISANRNPQHPFISTHGGAKLRYARRYKQEYQDQIFDRAFYFLVSSPQTGNFMQNEHEYDPQSKEYTVPIRSGSHKYVRHYFFHNVELDRILNIVVSGSLDYGVSIYHGWLYQPQK